VTKARLAIFGLVTMLMLVLPAAAFAQATTGPYFSAGVAFERRNLGNDEVKTTMVGLNSVTTFVKPIKPAPAATVGVFLSKAVAVEAQVERSTLVTWPYTYSYPEDITKHTAEHRDTLLLGNVRIRVKCRSAVCIEPVAGAGLAVHHSSSVTTATCGQVGAPLPCTPANKPDWDANELKLALDFGADVRLGMNPRFAIVPSLRIHFIDHNSDALHGTDQRLPDSGDRWFLAFGVSISVR
jgi:hypothetical protein